MRLRAPFFALCASLVPLLPAQDGKTAPKPEAQPAEAAAKKTPPPLVIGVVDLGRVFDLHPRTIRERERLQREGQEREGVMKELDRRASELKGLIPNLKEGSRERGRKELEYDLLLQQKRATAQLLSDEMRAEQAKVQLAIYEELEAAVKQLAKDRGLSLVLRIDVDDKSSDDEKQGRIVSRLRTFEQRQVLFAAEELDLTPALIKLVQVPLDPASEAPPAAPQNGGKDGK
ncbi:MAG: OmpH family outer membrane protein [Planctomycetes bacterium]|nr:OmpH family outer membrane protein [Planctomycetota bacterium]